MSQLDLILRTKELLIQDTSDISKIKEIAESVIKELTDSDYNGDNTEYYLEDNRSKLDNYMDKFNKLIEYNKIDCVKLVKFIEQAVYGSCENDDYYRKIDIKSNYHFNQDNSFFAVVSVAQIAVY
ncbi:hypothetical protein [Faecalibacillus faecis]|uniref:hypothetical protein n=1 Tax=Faecalibacillus faecis TaxID=1982628 RepID=UPI00386AFE12